MRVRRIVAPIAAALVVASSVGAGTPRTADEDRAHIEVGELAGGHVGTLHTATDGLFWATPTFTCGELDEELTRNRANTNPPKCSGLGFAYTFTLDRDADELRVAFDQPYRQDTIRMFFAGQTASSSGTFTREIRMPNPRRGSYTVSLIPDRATTTLIRLRAVVVDDLPPGPAGEVRDLLPNMRAMPPFEFGFTAPAHPLNGPFLAGDGQNPPLVVQGQRPISCTTDEREEAAQRGDVIVDCLRFTSGPLNAGEGHWHVEGELPQDMEQVVYRTDGTSYRRPAGTWQWHATHAHVHYNDLLYYELLAVDEVTGELSLVGDGHKNGFCTVPQGFADWDSVRQVPYSTNVDEEGFCLSPAGPGMSLMAGWGDVYRWQRAGQYVDFTNGGDGLWVVRATVDVNDFLLESDETDNEAYALIRVRGREVEVLERGMGSGPGDPARSIVNDGRF